MSATVLDSLVEHLRARDTGADGQERPAAILWTDPRSEWLPVVEPMRARSEELLVLGAYRPEARTGPAIWIRCVVDGVLDEPVIPNGRAPIVYLPGVGRQALRAGEECPPALRPLVELMYRGTLWAHPNGNDWTASGFLSSSRALGLEIAHDGATAEALLRALPEIVLTPVDQLRDHHLAADDFDRMLAGDVLRDALRWIGDPATTRTRLGASGWGAFRNRCRDELDLDPETEADIVAGERLGRAEGAWALAWVRLAVGPASYPGVVEVLRRSRPPSELPFDRERWPDLNDEDERAVRDALASLPRLAHREACGLVARLERAHGPRRQQVWARIGLSPMARVLEPLARLAGAAGSALGGSTPDEVASAYLARGWQADAATWEALALAPAGDEALVAGAIRHLLGPWLDDSARAFQDALARAPLPGRGGQSAVEAPEGGCLLFADGLRFDLGQRLAERLEARGHRVRAAHRWAALPSVTATAKPAVTPVADEIAGERLGEDLAPALSGSGRPVSAQRLRDAMRGRGYQILDGDAADVPLADAARGWIEGGDIDTLGHKLGARLARQIPEEIERLAIRIEALLDQGWQSVRVVTDHGWLLLPGGLPKVDLPKHLTETRWARCAVLAGRASGDALRAPWHWNALESFATAPGAACFNKTEEYAHGGLSVQECLIPDLVVERAGETALAAEIVSITWRGLRCFLEVRVTGGAVTADLRLASASGPSVVATAKPVEADGTASLVLAGDENEADPLTLVLIDDAGRILDHRPTRAGVDS